MMKFQGKKSGKYAGFIGWFEQIDNGWDDITVVHSDSGSYKRDKYKTIAEFNKDWEDYEEPKETDPEKPLQEEELADLWRELKKTDLLLDSLNMRVRALEKDSGTTSDRTIPPHEKFERMKQDLRDWIDRNEPEKIRIYFSEGEDGRPGVLFEDRTHLEHTPLVIMDWPRIGLKDGGAYTPDELLITGEAGKE